MDSLNRYRQLIRQELSAYANFSKEDSIKNDVLFDSEHDRYQLISMGWEGDKRILQPVIHIDLIEGKVWVQEDKTDWAIADALVQAGIPKTDIVLGFHPPYIRPHTGFAVS